MVKVGGFKKVEVDVDRAEATVTYDAAKTTPEKLVEAIRKGTRFKVTVKEKKTAGETSVPDQSAIARENSA